MTNALLPSLMLGIVTASLPVAGLCADEDAGPPTILSVSRSHAGACRVFPTEHPDQPWKLREEPILRRQQNTMGNSLGYTFLWLEPSGRPAALCDVFFFKNFQENRMMLNEWHSFSTAPLTARGPGAKDVDRVFLKASGPGLEWKIIPDAEEPAKTAVGRKLQMTQLARRFSVELMTSQGDKHELRLLGTPLYQYDSRGDESFLSGALFAYCVETDPEVLASIEARRVNEQYVWQYGLTATSIARLFVKLDERDEIWKADPPVFDVNSPHSSGYIKDVRVPLPPGQLPVK